MKPQSLSLAVDSLDVAEQLISESVELIARASDHIAEVRLALVSIAQGDADDEAKP